MNHADGNAPVSDIDLMQFDEDFANAPIEERDFDEVPDGKYQVNVEKVELTHSQNNNPMLKWGLRILGPNHANRMLWRNNVLVTTENVKWLKNDLYVCGLELEKLSDLPGQLDELLDVKLEVTKRTREDYSNIYINRRIVSDDEDVGQDSDTCDDIPF